MSKDLKEYMLTLPEDRRKKLKILSDLITRLFPEVEVSMKYKMPTFSLPSGWVSIANQKNYVSLYTCDTSHIKNFRLKHPEIKTGKGCINFKPSDELCLENLEEVIQSALLRSAELKNNSKAAKSRK